MDTHNIFISNNFSVNGMHYELYLANVSIDDHHTRSLFFATDAFNYILSMNNYINADCVHSKRMLVLIASTMACQRENVNVTTILCKTRSVVARVIKYHRRK